MDVGRSCGTRVGRDSPQEYALIFGSPVPGYQAPPDTVDPAVRIPLLVLQILGDAVRSGRILPPDEPPSRGLSMPT